MNMNENATGKYTEAQELVIKQHCAKIRVDFGILTEYDKNIVHTAIMSNDIGEYMRCKYADNFVS